MVLYILVHKTTNKPIQLQDEDGDKKTVVFTDHHKAEIFLNQIDEKMAQCYNIRLYKSLTGTVNVERTVKKYVSAAEIRAENLKRLEAEKESRRLMELERQVEERLRKRKQTHNARHKREVERELAREEAESHLPDFLL